MEGVEMRQNKSFWDGKRVLVTGHSGFKGSWLSLWLTQLKAKVTGISLPPPVEQNLFSQSRVTELMDSKFADIRDAESLSDIVQEAAPEIVFHLAAQPLVRASYQNPLETFNTNIMGTANLLESLRKVPSLKVVVIITTDKVYQDQQWPYPYRENDILGGHDPYSASKAACEIVTASYRDAFLIDQGIALATARAGNVIGGGDWAADRLIPDAVRAWQAGTLLKVRNPQSIRPWQHVLEPLYGYQRLVEELWQKPQLYGAYNFGPETGKSVTVQEILDHAQSCYRTGQKLWVAARSKEAPHETNVLTLETSKARIVLDVAPKLTLYQAISQTMDWYSRQEKGDDSRSLCLSEISEYEALL